MLFANPRRQVFSCRGPNYIICVVFSIIILNKFQPGEEPDGEQLQQEMTAGTPLQQEGTQEEMDPQNITLEAVSVSDPSQQSQETEAFLKKIEGDTYNEDEVWSTVRPV